MIAQNDFTRQWKVIGPKVIAAVERVGSSGWYILGKEVERFEASLAEYLGVDHVVGVGNGMDALEIALRCADLPPGSKVLTTPLSAFATTLAILRAGGTPVFVDVDQVGNLDFEQASHALRHDATIRCLVPVHLYGNPLDLDKLAELKAQFELTIVEDCAQAIGAKCDGRPVGTIGDAAGTSFYPTKNLGALGDGGAILTNNAEIAARARALRNYGQSSLYMHSERGLNSRLDEMQAAIMGDALLPLLESWTTRRREIARKYQEGLANPNIEILSPGMTRESVWHLFPILVTEGRRDELREFLRSCDIMSGIHYPKIIPEQEALTRFPGWLNLVEPVNAASFSRRELSLPIHPFLTDEEVTAVIGACNRLD